MTAPAMAPALAMLKCPTIRLEPPAVAAMDSPKKAPPVTNITAGVAMAATLQPRNWNTNRPASMRAMVAYPVAMDTSARIPCSCWPPRLSP